MLYHIKTEESREFTREQLYYGVGLEATYQTTEDLCAFFQIKRYELPAFVLIDKYPGRRTIDSFRHQYSVFPIKDTNDLDSFLLPIKIANDFKKDYDSLYHKLSNIRREPTYAEVKSDIESIEKGIESVSSTSKDDLDESLYHLLSEINSSLGEYGITQPLPLVSPYEYKKFLIQNGIIKEYMISHCDLFSKYKKIYNKVAKWDEQKTDSLTKLQNELSQKKGLLEKAKTRESRIEELEGDLSFIIELYKKKFEEKLLMDDATSLVSALSHWDSALPDILENTIRSYMHKEALIKGIVYRIREKVRKKQFNVFISCKSEDYEAGERVYAFLKSKGYMPFIASKSLREIGEAQYSPVIAEVIDICRHMIVFASDIQYIDTPYVHSEWTSFCNEEKAGRKNGTLLTILKDPKQGANLPLDLRSREVLPIYGYEESICSYLS